MDQLRDATTVIFDKPSNRFHFTQNPLRVFQNGRGIWFPVDSTKGMFLCIEEVIQDSGIGNHVVNLEVKREYDNAVDLTVTYSIERKSHA